MFPFNSSFITFLADKNATFWFPEQASTFAPEVDWFYDVITWLGIVCFVLMMGAMGYFMVVYRQRPGYRGSPKGLHNTPLELTWTIIPSFIVVWIFVRGAYGYLDMMQPPTADTVDINVTAKKWFWTFNYPNGVVSPELHVPIDRPAKMIMRSDDFLHAFFVPAFRVKSDIVPGRFTPLWFTPTKLGVYDLFCAEYCGDDHSLMKTKVFVQTEADYEAWLAKEAEPPNDPVLHGLKLYTQRGCKGCHSIDGTKSTGPSFAGSWGKEVKLSDGKTMMFDENFVKTSVTQPQAMFRAGFERASAMPSFQGIFKENQIEAIIAYLKSLENAKSVSK